MSKVEILQMGSYSERDEKMLEEQFKVHRSKQLLPEAILALMQRLSTHCQISRSSASMALDMMLLISKLQKLAVYT
jgi:hypothetical protein